MTLVQVSIADKGKSIVLIADRLLTSWLSEDIPSYEFESQTPKIIHRGSVGIGFAGTSIYADLATCKVGNKKDFDVIVKTISTFFKNEKKTMVDAFIKRLCGVSSEMFFKRADLPIPVELRNYIYGKLSAPDGQINCSCIVTGFDKRGKARVVIIDGEGSTLETTTFSNVSIGSGAPFSKVYFDLCNYDCCMGTSEALLFAYEAKKWAQSHTGVGDKTDILLFRKSKKVLEINDSSKLMKNIDAKYDEEHVRHHTIRRDLLKDILR